LVDVVVAVQRAFQEALAPELARLVKMGPMDSAAVVVAAR